MELLKPIKELPEWLALVSPKEELEPASTEKPQDELQSVAKSVGRSNVSYEHVWSAVRRADGLWLPVRCNSVRRAILLASSALQHRTQAHDVWRRGRVVCVRLKDGRPFGTQQVA
jgi:hypothetical protein